MKKEKSKNIFNIILISTLLICLIMSMGKTHQRDKEISDLKEIIRVQQSVIVDYQYEE